MRHVIADDGEAISRLGPRVVERVVETEFAQRTFRFELGEVRERTLPLDTQRKRGGVWRDDEVLADAALERQVGYAERAILIGEMAIAKIVGALARTPRHAVVVAECNLPAHRAPVRLVEQRERIGAH